MSRPKMYEEVSGIRINPRLIPLLDDVEGLLPHPDNPNTHNSKNVNAIKRSLEKFGFQLPIIVDPKTKRIVVGHGRLQAMRALKWTKAPVLWMEGSSAELKAFMVAENRTGELSEWDTTMLGALLGELSEQGFDVEDLGFSEFDVDSLLAEPELDAGEDFGDQDGDQDIPGPKLAECPECGCQFST